MEKLIYNDFKQYNEENKLSTKIIEDTHLPWVEKFRPNKLDDVISNNQIKSCEIIKLIKSFRKKIKTNYIYITNI